jgi:succinate dehydrogenase membrane anchor subunit
MSMRTPLKNARNLGSAKEGADHFWKQRVTGLANAVLALFLVWLIVSLTGSSYLEVREALAQPWIALPIVLLILSAAVHMRLGMQVIIEDYISHDGVKLGLLVANTFFAVGVAATAIFSVLRIGFGG